MTRASDGTARLFSTTVLSEQGVFALRRYGRIAAQAAGSEHQDQIRLATTLSELGRDLLADGAVTATFGLAPGLPAALLVTLEWQERHEPSVESLDAASRLMHRVVYEPEDRRGRVVVEQQLPVDGTPPDVRAGRVREALRTGSEDSMPEDLRAQTRDLIATLEETRAQREELRRLNKELEETNQGVMALYAELSRELEDTNSGVVALYAEIDEKTRQLREASEAKTRFWANVSHELRAPVNSVVGLARLLLGSGADELSEEQRHQISLIAASGNTMLALVNELLDVAKAESGRLEPQYTLVGLRALFGQLRDTMRGAVPNDDVTLVVPDLTTAPRLLTDEVMLTRILRNLLSNGLKFTETGEVRLDLRAEPPHWLVFTVTDTGVGIPPDQQERVFEEFYQVVGPHQRGCTGTGLGLPYARRLAELLGGSLTLRSTLGEGTTVTLRLPTSPEPVSSDTAPAPTGVRLRVLVFADDDPAFRAVFRPVLDDFAEHVVEVHDGDSALQAVRTQRPDAVLVDLQMPGTDGYAVVAQLAADPELRHIPVIVITSAVAGTVDRDRLTHATTILQKSGLTPQRLATALLAGTPAANEHPGEDTP